MSALLDPTAAAARNFRLTARTAVVTGLVLLAAVPLYAALTGDAFAVTLFTRVLILALAAVSLNLIMGYGGMVSFGHAAYLGLGGYAVGTVAGRHCRASCNGRWRWPSALFALIVGA